MVESPAAHNILLFEFLKRILALAGNPAQAKEAVCEGIRQLAAARLAVVVERPAEDARWTVQPNHRHVDLPMLAAFCRRIAHSAQPFWWQQSQAEPGDELASFGVANCLAIPLLAGERTMGNLLVFDCAMTDNILPLRQTMEMLSSVLGLILRNADVHLEARRLAEERTRQLQLSEQTLREAQACYDELAARIPSGVYRLRGFADGRAAFEYVSPRFAEMLNLSVETCLADADAPFRCLHPEDGAAFTLKNQQSMATLAAFSAEARFIVGGEAKWMLVESTPTAQADGGSVWHGVMTDITERKQAEEKLRLIARVFDATLEGIMITNAERELIDVNEAFTQITGYTREEVLGKNPRILQSGHQDKAFYAAMWECINRTGHWNGELWNRRKDGKVYPEWISISAITDAKGAVTHYVGISSDITLLKLHEKRLERIAHYDALTGIPNRVLLMDRMRHALAQAQRDQCLLAVCYLDLDGFKPINDTLGHEAGDAVLVEIAQRIGDALRASDTVARLGGDEFVVLLQGIESAENCDASLQRLLQVIAQPIILEERAFIVTASIGVTLFPHDYEDPDTLLRHADQAMYLAKQMGKNRYRLFDPRQDERVKAHREQKMRIKQGLLWEEFEVFYQPKVVMPSWQVAGVEALIRWRHPHKGLLLPEEFLPLIENSELEVQMGSWVVNAVLSQMERWRSEGLELGASVNIAAAHLQSPGFVENLRQSLAQHPGLQPCQLQLELMETAALADISAVAGIIEACLRLGVRFALDDFGTGYSSLAYLRRLPADTLKIDRSFVRDMLVDKEDRAIVQGVIALAHAFNRTTVAEGVETPEHFKVLSEMGCDLGQGYGIAPPMPAVEVGSWCRYGGCRHG